MALKGIWTDKVDGIDDVLAADINLIANAVIAVEEAIGDSEDALESIILQQKNILEEQKSIIAIQNSILGGS